MNAIHTEKQRNNPLHGLTLQTILTELLRKTPWVREKLEGLYGFMLREKRRES